MAEGPSVRLAHGTRRARGRPIFFPPPSRRGPSSRARIMVDPGRSSSPRRTPAAAPAPRTAEGSFPDAADVRRRGPHPRGSRERCGSSRVRQAARARSSPRRGRSSRAARPSPDTPPTSRRPDRARRGFATRRRLGRRKPPARTPAPGAWPQPASRRAALAPPLPERSGCARAPPRARRHRLEGVGINGSATPIRPGAPEGPCRRPRRAISVIMPESPSRTKLSIAVLEERRRAGRTSARSASPIASSSSERVSVGDRRRRRRGRAQGTAGGETCARIGDELAQVQNIIRVPDIRKAASSSSTRTRDIRPTRRPRPGRPATTRRRSGARRFFCSATGGSRVMHRFVTITRRSPSTSDARPPRTCVRDDSAPLDAAIDRQGDGERGHRDDQGSAAREPAREGDSALLRAAVQPLPGPPRSSRPCDLVAERRISESEAVTSARRWRTEIGADQRRASTSSSSSIPTRSDRCAARQAPSRPC